MPGYPSNILNEFQLSGLPAEIFDKETRTMFAGQMIEIMHIDRLQDEMGPTTVDVDAFEE